MECDKTLLFTYKMGGTVMVQVDHSLYCCIVYYLSVFCHQMLSETIMHECVIRLLRSPVDEESLKCFARLMSTAGKDLDHPQAKVRGRKWGEGSGWGEGETFYTLWSYPSG